MKILAGIVTYNPNVKRLIANIDSIKNQVDMIIIIDNNSKNKKSFIKKINIIKKLEIIELDDNYGIATALNKILEYSYIHNYSWFLTLDQDTIVSKNIIEEYKKFIHFPKIGMINSNYYDDNMNEQQKDDYGYKYVDCCITSATLNNTNVIKKIGGYDEKMFIDMVDFDICATLIKNGYKIIKLNKILYNHEIGESKVINILGKKIVIYNEKPIRVYYFTRNNIYYINKHNKGIKGYFFLIRKCLIILLFEKDKMSKFKMMKKGIKDAKKMNY